MMVSGTILTSTSCLHGALVPPRLLSLRCSRGRGRLQSILRSSGRKSRYPVLAQTATHQAGTGLTSAVPGMRVRTVGADSLQDAQLQESLGAEFFRVDWSAKPNGGGKTRITGYVYSDKGRAADDVQLHISELDASGKQVGSYFERMLESVPAEGRGYFDVNVPVNAEAASYHVAVYSWNDVEGSAK